MKGPGRRCVLSTSMGNVPRLRSLYASNISRAQRILSEDQERDDDETPGVIADLFRYSLHPLGSGKTVPRIIATKSNFFRMTSTN